MNEAIAKRRSGRPMRLPVVSIHVEKNVMEIVLYAAKFVYAPTPEGFIDLELAVKKMDNRARRRKHA